MQQSSQMQIQHSNGSQPQALTNLQRFIQNYNKYITENPTVEFNSQKVVQDIAANILQPPQYSSSNQMNPCNEDLSKLYRQGKDLPQLFDQRQPYLSQTVSRLKKLKQEKVYQTILFIEQLNYKLNKQYENQIERGIQNGVYGNKSGSGSMENIHVDNKNSAGQNGNNATGTHIRILERK